MEVSNNIRNVVFAVVHFHGISAFKISFDLNFLLKCRKTGGYVYFKHWTIWPVNRSNKKRLRRGIVAITETMYKFNEVSQMTLKFHVYVGADLIFLVLAYLDNPRFWNGPNLSQRITLIGFRVDPRLSLLLVWASNHTDPNELQENVIGNLGWIKWDCPLQFDPTVLRRNEF